MWEVHPLIRRQLRQTLLGKLETRERSRFSWGLSVVVLIWFVYVWIAEPGRCGDYLFLVLLGIGLFGAFELPLYMTADLLIEEKRSGMYELLFLCGLRPLDVFITKITGVILISTYRLLYIVPFLVFPLAGGGVTWSAFLYVLVILPLLFFLMLCLGILGSALTDEDTAVRTLAKTIVILLGGLPYLIQYIGIRFMGIPFISPEWLALSPAFGPMQLFYGFEPVSWPLLIKNGLYVLTYSALALGVASMVVKRTWRLDQVKRFGQRGRFWHMVRNYLTGDAATRPAYLDAAPMRWLAGHELRPLLQAWLAMLLLFGGWLLVVALFADHFLRIFPLVGCITIFSVVYASFVAYTAARRLAVDKADGQLEILLTTPLTSEDILNGLREGVVAQFKHLKFFCHGLWVLLFTVGIFIRTWNWQGLLIYTMIWANFWIIIHYFTRRVFFSAIEQVIVSGKPVQAVASGFGLVGTLVYVFYFMGPRIGNPVQPKGSLKGLIVMSCLTLIIFLIFIPLLKRLNAKLLAPAKNLRTIIAGDKVEEK